MCLCTSTDYMEFLLGAFWVWLGTTGLPCISGSVGFMSTACQGPDNRLQKMEDGRLIRERKGASEDLYRIKSAISSCRLPSQRDAALQYQTELSNSWPHVKTATSALSLRASVILPELCAGRISLPGMTRDISMTKLGLVRGAWWWKSTKIYLG